MPNIDRVRVNGTEYSVSSGGTLPIAAYRGGSSCGLASFDDRTPADDEMFCHIRYPSFFTRRTPGVDGKDMLFLVTNGSRVEDLDYESPDLG